MTTTTGASLPSILGVFKVSSTQALMLVNNQTTWYIYLVSVSGLVPSEAAVYTGLPSNYGSQVSIAAVQMNADEWWFFSSDTAATGGRVIRVKWVSVSSITVNEANITGRAAGDIVYNQTYGAGYNPEYHGAYTKLDAASCLLSGVGANAATMVKVTWNGSAFVVSSPGNPPLPAGYALPYVANRPLFVAGPNAGYFATYMTSATGINGTSGSVAIFSLDSKLGAGIPDVLCTHPVTFAIYDPTTIGNCQELEIVYRNGKAHFMVPPSTSGGFNSNTGDVHTIDLKTGEQLSKSRVSRGSFQQYNRRQLMTFKSGAIVAILCYANLTVLELAK
jgi:hypothetical protein